jgi:hypothetical protein
MNDKNETWDRLVAGARRAPVEPGAEPPFGFVARVVAIAFEREKRELLWKNLSLRALGFASLVVIATMTIHFSGLQVTAFDDIDIVDEASADLFLP